MHSYLGSKEERTIPSNGADDIVGQNQTRRKITFIIITSSNSIVVLFLFSGYYAPGILVLQSYMQTSLILRTKLQGGYDHFLNFTNKEPET